MTCNGHASAKRGPIRKKPVGEVLLQGWLDKRGPTAKYCFKQHWCVLKPKCLSYYADQTKREKKGQIELNSSTRALTFNSPEAPGDAKGHYPEHPYGFVLDLDPSAGARRRLFYFAAANGETISEWIQAVDKAVPAVRGFTALEGGRLERRGSAFDEGGDLVTSTPAGRRRGSCWDDDDGDVVATPVDKTIKRKGSIFDDADTTTSAGVTEPPWSDSKAMESLPSRPECNGKQTGDLQRGPQPSTDEDEAGREDANAEESNADKNSVKFAWESKERSGSRVAFGLASTLPPSQLSQSSHSHGRTLGDKSRGVLVRGVMPIGSHFIYISKGSIIDFKGDVIVNAANEAGHAGGGLDGSLMRAAGPDVDAERSALPEVRPGVRIPVGKVRVTTAGKLNANYIVHAVGPNYTRATKFEALDLKLRDAYVASMEAAFERGCQSIGFALLSSGAFCADRGLENVLEIALEAVRSVLQDLTPTSGCVEVDLVAYESKELLALGAAARGLEMEGAPEASGLHRSTTAALGSRMSVASAVSLSPRPVGKRTTLAAPGARRSTSRPSISPRPRAGVNGFDSRRSVASRPSLSPRPRAGRS